MEKLLIADPSDVLTSALAEVLQNDFDLQICHDGETALELLLSFRPDALILNLMLPFQDGLTVLQKSTHRPRCILATTPFINTYIEQVCHSLGVQYLMILPATISALRVRLMDMVGSATAPKADIPAQVALHLHNLGIPTHLDGYRQLCAGIPLFAENPDMLLSKELYPAIAEQFDLPDARTVEHSIRKAIRSAWQKKDPLTWEKYFPANPQGNIPCPTNKAFLARLAALLEH